MADSEYVCTLDEKSIKKAKKELGEDPKQRLGAVETFRTWILQQKHIKCDTDTLFLLRFLRSAKFSQLKARTLLENFLKGIVDYPSWMQNIDVDEPGIQAFLKCGYFVPSGVDSEGRRTLVCKMSNFEPTNKAYTSSDIMKGSVAMFYSGWNDEINQVNGNIYLMDIAGYTIKHSTFMSMDDMKKSTKMWQNAFPARYKGFHYYNMSPIFEGILTLIKPIMSKKWTDRIKVHSTMESVYKHIHKDCLPQEYLPDEYKGTPISHQQYIDDFYKTMMLPEVKERVKRMSDPSKFWIDLKEKDTDVPQASFRKLNID